MLRPWASTRSHPGQPCMVGFRAMLWAIWGPPPSPKHLALHVGCDNHRCLNPFHGRWGTIAENRAEARLHRAYFKAWKSLQPGTQRNKFKAQCHPTVNLMAWQGFPAHS